MYEVLLRKPKKAGEGSPHLHRVLSGLAAISSRRGRVFNTFVEDDEGNRRFCFVTASKDTHLFLGEIDDSTQLSLALLFDEEFDKAKQWKLLAVFPADLGWKKEYSFFVTLLPRHRTPRGKEVTTFHLASAH